MFLKKKKFDIIPIIFANNKEINLQNKALAL